MEAIIAGLSALAIAVIGTLTAYFTNKKKKLEITSEEIEIRVSKLENAFDALDELDEEGKYKAYIICKNCQTINEVTDDNLKVGKEAN